MKVQWSQSVVIVAHIWVYLALKVGATKEREDSNDGQSNLNLPTRIENHTVPESVSVEEDALDAWVPPKFIRENFPYYVSGFDYDGRPIFISEVGKYDYAAALAIGGEEMERNILLYWDQGIKNINKLASQLEEQNGLGEYAFIVDFDGFSLDHVSSIEAMRLNLKLLAKFEKLGEKLGYGFFLNANHVTSAFINAARPLFGTFLERVEIYGTRKEVWLPKILRKIPPDQIPPQYGGKKNFVPAVVF